MSTLLNSLIYVANKKLNAKGVPVYTVNLQSAIDEGFMMSEIKKAAKSKGMRLVKNDTTLSFDSHDLQVSLSGFIDALQPAK